jgi:hypothetical protein
MQYFISHRTGATEHLHLSPGFKNFVCIFYLFPQVSKFQNHTTLYSKCSISLVSSLTLILLTWRIWWAPNNASKWRMGFNSAFKESDPHVRNVSTINTKYTSNTILKNYNERNSPDLSSRTNSWQEMQSYTQNNKHTEFRHFQCRRWDAYRPRGSKTSNVKCPIHSKLNRAV